MRISGRRHHEERFCQIILNLDEWFRKRWRLKIFLFRALVAILFSGAEALEQFGSGYHEEQFCESILNLGQWFRRCHFKTFLI